MYKVRGKKYQRHVDARQEAVSASAVFPVRLTVCGSAGHSWYWHGEYKGRRFIDLFSLTLAEPREGGV